MAKDNAPHGDVNTGSEMTRPLDRPLLKGHLKDYAQCVRNVPFKQ